MSNGSLCLAVINVDAETSYSVDGSGRWQLFLVTVIAASSSIAVIGCICFAAVAMTKRRRNYGTRCSSSSSMRVVGVSAKTANLVTHWQLPSQRSNAGGRYEMRNNVLVYDGSPVSGVTASTLGYDERVPMPQFGRKLFGGGRLATGKTTAGAAAITVSEKERLRRLTEYEMPLDEQWEFPRSRCVGIVCWSGMLNVRKRVLWTKFKTHMFNIIALHVRYRRASIPFVVHIHVYATCNFIRLIINIIENS